MNLFQSILTYLGYEPEIQSNSSQINGVDRVILLFIRYISWKLQYQNRIRSLPQKLNNLATSITLGSYRQILNILRYIHPEKYTHSDPYKIIYVDPNQISNLSGLHDQRRRGWVIDGDWDLDTDEFMESPVPKSIKQRFEYDVAWSETPLADQYDNQEKFETKCEKIDSLYSRIEKEGYKSQRQILDSNPERAWEGVNTTISPITNEVTVDIGRNGEILWNMLGRHRLAIAKTLEIERIPVLVYARHTQWHKSQYKYLKGKLCDQNTPIKEHPDME